MKVTGPSLVLIDISTPLMQKTGVFASFLMSSLLITRLYLSFEFINNLSAIWTHNLTLHGLERVRSLLAKEQSQ